MADRPETLRLFDLGPQEVMPASSRPETTRVSRSEMPEPSQSVTGPQGNAGMENPLRAIGEAATMVTNADRQLAAAIQAARAAGRSWREIGIAAGVPYQTLHRRYRKEERDDVTS